MLVSADWVVSIAHPPIRDGAVRVVGDRIAEVGAAAALTGAYPAEEREHFAGCVITPGLVNAHTHLTLTALAGVVPPMPLVDWLPRLVEALKPWDIADHEASGVIGAEQSLLAGVTVVGDIAYGAAEVASASRAGLGGVFYWELLGLEPGAVASELARLRYPQPADAYGPRVIAGLSPHSPYTSGPGLLVAVREAAERLGVPVAVHVAESAAEVELLEHGTGPLAGTASRTAIGFEPPHTSTVRYLDALGALDGATAVHCCYLAPGDTKLLAARARGIVTCPRSNRYLGNPPPAVRPLLEAGIAIGIGTDSTASNTDLDLLGEVRALRRAEPGLSAEALLEIATARGAKAIGVADRFGALAEGMQADLAVFRVPASDVPARALVAAATTAAPAVDSVMSGGVWRVRKGMLLHRDAHAAARAAQARELSREALAL